MHVQLLHCDMLIQIQNEHPTPSSKRASTYDDALMLTDCSQLNYPCATTSGKQKFQFIGIQCVHPPFTILSIFEIISTQMQSCTRFDRSASLVPQMPNMMADHDLYNVMYDIPLLPVLTNPNDRHMIHPILGSTD
jgi:hypothetical protein